ncbi:MAG: NUDIX hydrolase [Thermodesulfovibrionales bacterium]
MQIIGKKNLWTGRYLKTSLITYRDPAGHIRDWECVERQGSDGVVVIIPITPEKEFILVRQFRPVVNSFVIEFPAGLISPNEPPSDTAKRELIEETGYYSTNLEFLVEGPISSGMSNEIIKIYIAKDIKKADEQTLKQFPPDQSEFIEIIKVPLDIVYERLDELRTQGNLIDLKIYGMISLVLH